MSNIQLTQELVKSLFDYKDGKLYWKVKRYRTNIGDFAGTINKGRCAIKIYGKLYYRARLIFLYHYGYLPEFLDHVDRNSLNDRIENLRKCTKSENSKNRTPRIGLTSKYLGVHFKRKKWNALIRGNSKNIYGGSFKTEIEAALAYNKLAVKYHGEFANLNIIKN